MVKTEMDFRHYVTDSMELDSQGSQMQSQVALTGKVWSPHHRFPSCMAEKVIIEQQ